MRVPTYSLNAGCGRSGFRWEFMCSERLREWVSGATADPGGQSLGRRRFEHPSEPGPLSLGSHDDDVGPLARSQAVHFPEPRIDVACKTLGEIGIGIGFISLP